MKKTLLTLTILTAAVSGFSQGQVIFNNRIAGVVDARIYGPEPTDATVSKTGNPSTGVPAGTTVYGGAQLAGTGFYAALVGGPLGTPDNSLAPALTGGTNALSVFSTLGRVVQPGSPDPSIQGVLPGTSARLGLRVWDNRGRTVNTWAAVLSDDSVLRGQYYFDSAPLGGGIVASAPLTGLQSFNLFTPVPEPSLIALGALGLGALLLRRRKA